MTSRLRLAVALAALVLTAGAPPPAPASISQIPITSGKAGDTLAVLYSGDGGWGAWTRRWRAIWPTTACRRWASIP